MDNKIKRRRLGRTDLMVTELSLGAMNLRLLPSFEDAKRLVRHVLDRGVNLIDTARAYKGEIAPGVVLESEQVVGDVIRERKAPDEPLVLITKGHAYTVPALEADLADSLRTLGVEGRGDDMRIGNTPIRLIYLVHGISTERWETTRTSGVLDRLQELRRDGVVHHLGFSSHYPFPAEIREAADTGIFDVAELPYNVFHRGLGEDGETDLLKYLHDLDMGLINMKAFDGNGMVPVYGVLRDLISIDYPAMLRFCLSNPYITTVDAGAKYPEEFDLDIQVATDPARCDAAQLQALRDEADRVAGHMKNLCRECMHCMEKFSCPHGVDFPRILSLYSRFRILEALGKDTGALVAEYRALPGSGADCTACGECLPWCEYRLEIPDMLQAAHARMG